MAKMSSNRLYDEAYMQSILLEIVFLRWPFMWSNVLRLLAKLLLVIHVCYTRFHLRGTQLKFVHDNPHASSSCLFIKGAFQEQEIVIEA